MCASLMPEREQYAYWNEAKKIGFTKGYLVSFTIWLYGLQEQPLNTSSESMHLWS